MFAFSQDEEDLVNFYNNYQDVEQQQQHIDCGASQICAPNFVDSVYPFTPDEMLIDTPEQTSSSSGANHGSNFQEYFQPIPEALQRAGVICIGSRCQSDAISGALPARYPIWHHPRIGHFSPVQHDVEIGYYVPIQDPASFVSKTIPRSVPITLESTPVPEQQVQYNTHNKKRLAIDQGNGASRKKSKGTKNGLENTFTDEDVSSGQISPELRIKKDASNIVKSCICRNGPMLAPRPSNAFFLYKSQHSKTFTELAHVARQQGNNKLDTSAKQASKAWKTESEDVKNKFKTLAETEKQKHAQMYPDYRYEPNKKQANRFGDRNCSCGAYEENCAGLRSISSTGDSAQVNPFTKQSNGTATDDIFDDSFTVPAQPQPLVLHQQPAPVLPSVEHIDPILLAMDAGSGPPAAHTLSQNKPPSRTTTQSSMWPHIDNFHDPAFTEQAQDYMFDFNL